MTSSLLYKELTRERTMKILHTSDWHLGHTLYNYDRAEEQLVMLLQMVQIVKEQQPDVFLLCGDVYHTPQPSAAVQTMLTEALVEAHEARPEMVIVMTAGNHDSGTKHEIFRTPWKALNVYAIGQIEKDKPDEHIIEVPGKGLVVAIPYCNERNMPEGFIQSLLDEVWDDCTHHRKRLQLSWARPCNGPTCGRNRCSRSGADGMRLRLSGPRTHPLRAVRA